MNDIDRTESATVTGVVDAENAGLRLDAYISHGLTDLSRSEVTSRIEAVHVNDVPARLSRRLVEGDRVRCVLKATQSSTIEAEPIALDIVHETDTYLVVNKPAGMVVHPANGHWSGTLVQALMYRYPGIEQRFESRERPGIVHRLDRDTSGIILVAKYPRVCEALSRQFAARRTRKRYLALVKGAPPHSEGRVEGCIRRDPHHRKRFAWSENEGKRARTEYRVLARFDSASLIALAPYTGRTHQLRVHMQHLGCPIIGDTVYARGRDEPEGMMLHAASLAIFIPDEQETREFVTRFPERFRGVIAKYGGPEGGEDPGWSEVLREW
ncbi:MAG: RluA family pseudouridine synthase [Spirochaetota bacterium]